MCYGKTMQKNNMGKIDYSNLTTPPEKHERATAKFFANKGEDIVFLRPSSIKGTYSPDFTMGDKIWEVKSPTTYSKSSFEYNFKKAMKQAKHIIFDLRQLNSSNEVKYIRELYKWKNIPKVKTLLIITKDGRILTLKGKFDKL